MFKTDGDFCSDCGAILKIHQRKITIECAVCKSIKSLKSKFFIIISIGNNNIR